jgi:hypothetical protein
MNDTSVLLYQDFTEFARHVIYWLRWRLQYWLNGRCHESRVIDFYQLSMFRFEVGTWCVYGVEIMSGFTLPKFWRIVLPPVLVLKLERGCTYSAIQVRSHFVAEGEGSMILHTLITNLPDYTVSYLDRPQYWSSAPLTPVLHNIYRLSFSYNNICWFWSVGLRHRVQSASGVFVKFLFFPQQCHRVDGFDPHWFLSTRNWPN